MALQMVTRAEWGAIPPCHQEPLRTPITQVAFVYAASLACSDKEECCKLMRFMQRCHMGMHQMADMKHNFYISTDGTVFEGRGWLENTSNYDRNFDETGMKGKFITIARMGLDFLDNPLTLEEITAKETIIQYGVEHNYIRPDYKEVKGLFYQYFVDGNPLDYPTYEVWKPPPCSEKERALLYKCSTNSDWVKSEKEFDRVIVQK